MGNNLEIEQLKFPIGKFEKPTEITREIISEWISEIELFPKKLIQLVENLSEEELNWKYRPNGWSIVQVVHHCADSHMNSFIRFKLTLTEDLPTIKTYFENKWAELADVMNCDIQTSLKIVEGLHARWIILLKSISKMNFKKEFIHPESGRKISLAENVGIYAWHCEHHLAHIKQALKFRGKFN